MAQENVIEVASTSVRCIGDPAWPHETVKLVVRQGAVTVCPACGRRFMRTPPGDRIEPAAWPDEE